MPDKILDTRDLQKRLEELEGLRNALQSAIAELDAHKLKERPEDEDGQDEYDDDMLDLERAVNDCHLDFGEEEESELAELETMRDEISEWRHGETLIRDDYFEDYAMQLAEDIGIIKRSMPWPTCHIDWAEAASALQMDYSTVDYQGETYWYRS